MMRFAAGVLVAAAMAADTTPCCETCDVPGQEKYISLVDNIINNQCGECCMDPKDYDLYHKFEKNLVKANSTTPCLDLGYGNYSKTVTHGAFNVKMTLDLYKPSAEYVKHGASETIFSDCLSKSDMGQEQLTACAEQTFGGVGDSQCALSCTLGAIAHYWKCAFDCIKNESPDSCITAKCLAETVAFDVPCLKGCNTTSTF